MFARFFILTVLFVSGCTGSKEARAQQSLVDYFTYLEQGDYTAAQELYGGSYEILVGYNPNLNPDDHASLLQKGCQLNGFQCLGVRAVTFNDMTPKGEYNFTVEFNNLDGSLFELGACCGETPATPPQFQFEFRVVEGGDGKFAVLDLPVYVP